MTLVAQLRAVRGVDERAGRNSDYRCHLLVRLVGIAVELMLKSAFEGCFEVVILAPKARESLDLLCLRAKDRLLLRLGLRLSFL